MRDIVLTTLIFASLPLCLARPWIGILVWYWFGLMNPHRHTFGFAFDMSFAMMIGVAILVGVPFARDRKPIPWSRELVLLLVLVAYFTFTTFFAWAPDDAWMQWKKVVKIVLMTFVTVMFIYGKDRIRWLLLVVALSIGFYGIKGAIFTLTTGGLNRVEGPEGTFIEGNTFIGLALLMVTPLLVVLARDEPRRWLKHALRVSAAMCIISIVFTYSRGALVGLAAVAPLLFLRSKQKFLLLVLLIPLAIIGKDLLPQGLIERADTLRTYEEDATANQRLQSWTVAWNVAVAHPLTGAGFEFEYAPDNARWLSYGSRKYDQYITHSSSAHSIYFQVLGQHGFVAFALYMWLLVGALLKLQSFKKQAERLEGRQWIGDYASGLQIGMVGYMVSGAFLSSAYFDLALLYLSLVAVLQRELPIRVQENATPQPAEQGWQRRFADPPP